MAALLITPASGARFWTHRLGIMIVIAMVFGAISGFFGSYISYVAPNMPTGPWVVMCLSFLAIGSIWFAPKRGMLARYRVQNENRKKILIENVLKLFYHLGEKEENFEAERSINELLATRDLREKELKKGLHLLRKNNSVRIKEGNWFITKKGLNEAIRVIRLHRLWEMYLNQRLKLEPDHVHNDAEAIEHIITPEIEKQLEKELNFPEKDPHESIIPYSKN
jgi:manganese/zinc/iron transport system permease protein